MMPPKRIIAYKIRARDRELIERAAQLEECTMSELARTAALARARMIIRRHAETAHAEVATL